MKRLFITINIESEFLTYVCLKVGGNVLCGQLTVYLCFSSNFCVCRSVVCTNLVNVGCTNVTVLMSTSGLFC